MKIKIKVPVPYGVNTGRLSPVMASPKGLEGVLLTEGTVSLRGVTKSLATGIALFEDLPVGTHPISFDVPNFKPVLEDSDPNNDNYIKRETTSEPYVLKDMPNISIRINAKTYSSNATATVNNSTNPPTNTPKG